MTELERLAEGIKRADKAGDAEAVKVLGARYRELQSAAQPASEEPSAMDNVLSGRGLLNLSPQEQVQMGAAPIMEPLAQVAAQGPPSLSAVGEIAGGTLGALAPTGRLPGLLAAGARAVGSGAGSFLGSYAGSGGDVEEAQAAGQRGMIGEGVGEVVGGLLRKVFTPKQTIEGAREAQKLVRSQGGNLSVGQMTETGFGKRAQEFIEMTIVGAGPLRTSRDKAEKILEGLVNDFVAQFPSQFGPEEAGRIIHKSIERAGIARLVPGKTLPSGQMIESKIVRTPYTGKSQEVLANRVFLKQLMDKAPDTAYAALATKKSPSAIRRMRNLAGADWDVIQGRYIHDLLGKSLKPGTSTNISGNKLFDKIKTINDPVLKEWIPDKDQRTNLLLTARSLALAESKDKTSMAGAAMAQSALFGGAGLGYYLGLTGLPATTVLLTTPYAVGRLISSKAYTDLMIEGMKPGLTPAKAAGFVARLAAIATEQGLTEGKDYQFMSMEEESGQ